MRKNNRNLKDFPPSDVVSCGLPHEIFEEKEKDIRSVLNARTVYVIAPPLKIKNGCRTIIFHSIRLNLYECLEDTVKEIEKLSDEVNKILSNIEDENLRNFIDSAIVYYLSNFMVLETDFNTALKIYIKLIKKLGI